MAKYFLVGVFLGALMVAACWAGISRPSLQADSPQQTLWVDSPQPPVQVQQSASGVRSPDGALLVQYKLKGADNVALLDGVTAIDFYPGCIAIQYKQGAVQRSQVLFIDRTEGLSWRPSPVKK